MPPISCEQASTPGPTLTTLRRDVHTLTIQFYSCGTKKFSQKGGCDGKYKHHSTYLLIQRPI